MVDGKKRTFMMTVPEAYNTQTEPEGVISLYPDGTSMKEPKSIQVMNMPGWNVGPCCSDDNDVDFTREMIAAVEEMVCIDKKRVYATGFSMGGGMAHQAACSMSDIFAAVATAGMDLNKTNSAKCEPERPIPVIMFRGTGDPVCRYQGGDSGYNDGLNFLGAEGSFRFWAEKDGCTGEPTTNSDDCEEYSNCKDGTKAVLCTNKGTPNKEGETNGHSQGDATIGWPFLKQFTLP
ncbi:MAG: dienelactone hydrolase family protein [Fibrobacter sp.]|nr:dienelactone hydrolase family protein [Fibrobacter sp.]